MYVLCLDCDDRPGIVAAVATTLRDTGCNIEEASQFNDQLSGRFFMRVVFSADTDQTLDVFKNSFQAVVQDFALTYYIADFIRPTKSLIMVSKEDHCLNDLLYRWRTNHLSIDITGVVSNHETCRSLAESHDLPFHPLPVTADTKAEQEKALDTLIGETGTELIILARYMQILSDQFCQKYTGKIINIHHSFLPGFKGARPYHQAHARGVKIIGATAHFVTHDLDEGPIIVQGTEAIDHTYTPKAMQALGRDTEARVLARAVSLYTEHRVFLNGNRTVIL